MDEGQDKKIPPEICDTHSGCGVGGKMIVILTTLGQVSIFTVLGDRIELTNGKYTEIKTYTDPPKPKSRWMKSYKEFVRIIERKGARS